MNRKALALVLAMMAAAGCTLNRSDLRKESFLSRIGGGGQIIEPKRCSLRVAILSRPLRDAAINDALWSVADEQAVRPEVQHAMEANGLRMGIVTGELPHEVEAILTATGPNKIEPTHFDFPDGENAMISLAEATPEVSVLLNQGGRALGKPYKDASGWLRLTANYEGTAGVKLRFVPEIHHGPLQRSFGALPGGGAYAPKEFMQKDGQQEDSLRDLAASVVVQPGQVVVIGCKPGSGSLGSYLFTKNEPKSDRVVQRVLLVWASRGGAVQGAGGSTPSLVPVEPPKSAQPSS